MGKSKGKDKIFDEAIYYRDNGKPAKAIQGFIKYIKEFPSDPKIHKVLTVLAGVYYDVENFEHSLKHFKSASELNPKSELASLGIYLSYIKLDKDEKAINELERYLNRYPAKIYKDTLEELLGDLNNGYVADYKATILKLAAKHDISLNR